jgi:prolipoprotein diacylglyceryltransferase
MGRVAHWGALLVVAAIVCGIAYAWLTPSDDPGTRQTGTVVFAVVAALILIVGRAIRYVLASE